MILLTSTISEEAFRRMRRMDLKIRLAETIMMGSLLALLPIIRFLILA